MLNQICWGSHLSCFPPAESLPLPFSLPSPSFLLLTKPRISAPVGHKWRLDLFTLAFDRAPLRWHCVCLWPALQHGIRTCMSPKAAVRRLFVFQPARSPVVRVAVEVRSPGRAWRGGRAGQEVEPRGRSVGRAWRSVRRACRSVHRAWRLVGRAVTNGQL